MAASLCAALFMLAALFAVGCGKAKTPFATATEALRSEVHIDAWKAHLPANAIPGARIFAESGCTACHTYRGVGSRNVGGSDLTRVGRRHSRRFFERFVANPAAFGNEVMPRFNALGPRRLRQLAIFLAASKGHS